MKGSRELTTAEGSIDQDRFVPGISSLRFLAFLLVYVSHLFPLFQIGHTGVQLFFVISSFLLTHLALAELKNTGRFSRKNFFIRRSLRIYPLYFLIIVFAFVVLPFLSNQLAIKITLPEKKWMYWIFLSNYEYSDHVFFLKLLWSIAVEEQFYLAFILFSFAFSRFHYLLCLTLFILYLVYMSLVIKGMVGNEYFSPFSYLPCFVSGMLIAKLFAAEKNVLPKALSVYILVAGVIFVSISFYQANDFLYYPFIACCYSALLLLVLLAERKLQTSTNWLVKLSEAAGKYTYGLYVYSGLVITLQLTIFEINNSLVAALVLSVILFSVAIFSYHFFEKPFLALKKRFRSSSKKVN